MGHESLLRDGTGQNTPDGAVEDMGKWETKKQLGVYEWAIFYEKHEKYEYLDWAY